MRYNGFMDYTNKDFLNRRPQRLCKMCGKCCRVVVASVPHEELVKNAENGDKSSLEFLELFEPYDSVADAMAVDEGIVKNIPEYENQTFFVGNVDLMVGYFKKEKPIRKRLEN